MLPPADTDQDIAAAELHDMLAQNKSDSLSGVRNKSMAASLSQSPVETIRQSGLPSRTRSPPSTVASDVSHDFRPSGWTSLTGTHRSHTAIEMTNMKLGLIGDWLREQQLQKRWISGGQDEGVLLRRHKDDYVCHPESLAHTSGGLYDAIRRLNVKCAMTVCTNTVRLLLEQDGVEQIPLSNGLHLQILRDVKSLPQAQKHQCAVLIQQPGLLVVWDDNPGNILDRVKDLENQMMSTIWKSHAEPSDLVTLDRKLESSITDDELGKSESQQDPPRKIMLIQATIVALTIVLMFAALGAGWRNVAMEIAIDRLWLRLAFPVIGPIQAWLGLFFMQTLATCAAQLFGPISQMESNSKFYSGIAPRRLRAAVLPHVTVQCPVYKEGLWTVIDPTIKSIEAAISTYELQGGSANIFINDDGMQALSLEQARERQQYYGEHNIGWVARPRHNERPANGERAFVRAGKFKKASNMNYALNVSVRIEELLRNIKRPDGWTKDQEDSEYQFALGQVVAEAKGQTWADGDVRVGDYILIIDSDTRVPKDCFLQAVSELEQSPEVAIIQFVSGVMNVTESWFEKGITFFTNLVYTAVKHAVANGDVAPFVGHNAFLRWSAVQDVAYKLPDDSLYEHFWSENTVSEDFDMALRLQTSGYIIRLADYTFGGFKEGVSLTVYDELARWEKYAYGCSELIFHPIIQWPFKGPVTPLFRKFIRSSIPFPSKITILAYIGTYFAIASAWLLTLINYLLVGWYNGYLDQYYIDSFKIYFAIIVVFNVFGNVALAVLRYRIDERPLLPSLVENFKWVLLLAIFLGGISLHLSQAILCHLFSINMSWGATSKEATNSSIFREIPVILRKFRFTFASCLVLMIGMIVLSGAGLFSEIIPHEWRINTFIATFPLGIMVASHALLPLVLNPGLMQFTF